MRFRHGLCLFFALGWAFACGGRYEQIVDGDDAPEAPSAGSSQAGGATSSAGTRSRGGAKTGGSKAGSTSSAGAPAVGGSGVVSGGAPSVAGTVGMAAAPSGGASVCAMVGCIFPYRAVVDANGCLSCELDQMTCDAIHANYRQIRAQMIDKYSQGCTQDADCVAFHDQNLCGTFDCGAAILTALSPSLAENLANYAQSNCSAGCPPEPAHPCPMGPAVRCLDNRCQ